MSGGGGWGPYIWSNIFDRKYKGLFSGELRTGGLYSGACNWGEGALTLDFTVCLVWFSKKVAKRLSRNKTMKPISRFLLICDYPTKVESRALHCVVFIGQNTYRHSVSHHTEVNICLGAS